MDNLIHIDPSVPPLSDADIQLLAKSFVRLAKLGPVSLSISQSVAIPVFRAELSRDGTVEAGFVLKGITYPITQGMPPEFWDAVDTQLPCLFTESVRTLAKARRAARNDSVR